MTYIYISINNHIFNMIIKLIIIVLALFLFKFTQYQSNFNYPIKLGNN